MQHENVNSMQHVFLISILTIKNEFILAQIHCDLNVFDFVFIDQFFAQQNNIEL